MLLLPATLLALLTPRLLLVRTTLLLCGPLTPTATLAGLLALARLSLRLTLLPRTRSALLSGVHRLTRLLTPTALLRRLTALRRLPLLRRLSMRGLTLLRRLLRPLTPTATTLAGRLLSPAALRSLSPRLAAWLAPRLPRTPRSLRRRRHIRSF